MAAPNVALCRPLRRGMTGDDVRAHKIAISRWNPQIYPWHNFSNYYGEFFESAVKTFQKRNATQLSIASGRIGQRTHDLLEGKRRHGSRTEWAFDKNAIALARDFCAEYGKTPEQRIREAIVSAAFFWYSHRYTISYTQYRPFSLNKPPSVPTGWDCSAFATNCHFAGGAPDPNGRGYDHLGYTGTLMSRGRPVASITELKPGDLIFYGFSSKNTPAFSYRAPTHVAVYVGFRNGQHMIISHGSYPMSYYNYRYRHDLNQMRTYDVTP